MFAIAAEAVATPAHTAARARSPARPAEMDEDEAGGPRLDSDLADLLVASNELGGEVTLFDAAAGAEVVSFRRGAQWGLALSAVRRLLKKYHAHARFPVRRALAEWGVFPKRILPLLVNFHTEPCVPACRGRQRRAAAPSAAAASTPARRRRRPSRRLGPLCPPRLTSSLSRSPCALSLPPLPNAATRCTTWARCSCS